ncbi:MAG: hypothetical protein R2708_25610 [Vicinamibacterales bacterium]
MTRGATDLRRLLPFVAVLATLAGACATGGAMQQARLAEQRQDYDLAVAEWTKAARSKPDDRTIRLSLDRAKRAAQDHFSGRAATPPPAVSRRPWSSTSWRPS